MRAVEQELAELRADWGFPDRNPGAFSSVFALGTLSALGPVLQGSILRRTITRADPAHPGQTKDYGPYYQWTRKVQGRTVIQNLSPSQAKTCARAIRENKKLEKTLSEMRATSLKTLELTTKGVPKRAPRRETSDTLS